MLSPGKITYFLGNLHPRQSEFLQHMVKLILFQIWPHITSPPPLANFQWKLFGVILNPKSVCVPGLSIQIPLLVSLLSSKPFFNLSSISISHDFHVIFTRFSHLTWFSSFMKFPREQNSFPSEQNFLIPQFQR